MSGNARALLDPALLYVTGSAPGAVSSDRLTVTASATGGGGRYGAGVALSPVNNTSAKVYFEFHVSDTSTTSLAYAVGIIDTAQISSNTSLEAVSAAAAHMFGGSTSPSNLGRLWYKNLWFDTVATYISSADVYQIAIEFTGAGSGKIWFGKNGQWQNASGAIGAFQSANPASTFSGYTVPTIAVQAKATAALPASITVNFGATPFTYSAPTGFTDRLSSQLVTTPPTLASAFAGNPAIVATLPNLHASMYAYAQLRARVPAVSATLASAFVTGTLDAATAAMYAALAGGTYEIAAMIPPQDMRASVDAMQGTAAHIEPSLPRFFMQTEGGAFEIAVLFPTPRIDIIAATSTVGIVNALAPRFDGQFGALIGTLGSFSASASAPQAALYAMVGTTGAIAYKLRSLTSVFEAQSVVQGQLSVLAKALEVAISGAALVEGNISSQLFSISAGFAKFAGTGQREFDATYVVNMLTAALSIYDDYDFNSFATIDGAHYGARDDGIYLLEQPGPIDAVFAFGYSSFGSEMQKRVVDFYAGMRAAGDMLVRVYVDERAPEEYILSPEDVATLKQRRCFIGKGLRGKYWRIEIANTNGAMFDFDSINIEAVQTARRI